MNPLFKIRCNPTLSALPSRVLTPANFDVNVVDIGFCLEGFKHFKAIAAPASHCRLLVATATNRTVVYSAGVWSSRPI